MKNLGSTYNINSNGNHRCDYDYIHFREEYMDYDGDGDCYNEEYSYCALGHSELYNRDFCVDYER